jgi:hypothetical protein
MGVIKVKTQSAASVPTPATDQISLFVDSSDSILKTKDSFGTVRPAGVGTADELSTTGSPVDVSASAPPTSGQTLVATSATTAVWASVRFVPTALQTGTINAGVGQLVLVNVTAGAATVNLPSAPVHGSQVGVKITGLATNFCTIAATGSDAIEAAPTLVLTTDYEWAILIYDSVADNWMQIG